MQGQWQRALLASCGMLSVMDPWPAFPGPLASGHCLFELYVALRGKLPVELIMWDRSPSQFGVRSQDPSLVTDSQAPASFDLEHRIE
eukprot:1549750-Pyramimonas_sp.AAC.1